MSNRKAKPIRIYEFNSTSFNNNGICTLFPSSAVITRDLNEHEYYLDLIHPIDDYGKWKEIVEDRIIKANGQPFRIVHVQKTMTEVIAYCEHIFYDLSNNFIEDTNIVSKNGRLAIDQILSNTVYSHGFSGTSDITTVANSRLVRKNVLEALLGDEDNSFINRWTNGNGELDMDGYSFKINNRIGQDRGYKITYGKNLTGINAKFDMKNVVTKIRPVGFDGIELNEKFVDSPYINNYAMPIIREYVYKDIKWKGSPNYQEKEDETGTVYETLAEAQAELKRRALLEFSENKIDLPSVTYDINFIELSNTEEYKDYQALSLINIGDDVTITHKKLGINIPSRCIAYKYNCLTSNFDEITLGHYNKNFFSEVKSSVSNAENILDGFDGTLNDFLQQSKDQITDYINGGFGGYVYITPNVIYIMDNPDINVAQSVMVLNQNGLGFSNTGINGTFETAITRDGHIVADFIDTGILKADLVKSGILESLNGKSWINMETGDFNLGDGKVKYENNQFQIAVSSNDINIGGSTLDEKFTEIDNKLEEITTTGGTKGDDAYSVILTNENYTFIANSDGSISSTQTVETNVLVYKGTKSISFTMSLPTVNGLTLSQSSNTVIIKANSGTSLADNGSFDITIQADGQTFTKSFSWCKSRKGWDAQYVMLSGEQVFKYTDNFTGEPTPTTINIKAVAYGINNPTYKWEYKQINQSIWSTISSATTNNQDYYNLDYNNKTIWGSDSTGIRQVSIRCTVNNTYSDMITIYKVSDGANGDNAKNVSLTATSQVFKSTDGGLTFSPDNIVITPTYQNVTHSAWKYSVDGGITWNDFNDSVSGWSVTDGKLTISKNFGGFTDEITSITIKETTDDASVTDTVTLTKLYDVTDIEIGGTNLAIGTNQGGYGWTWAIQNNGRNTKTSEHIDGVDCVKFVKDENDGSGWHFLCYDFFARDKIMPSTKYTVSFEIKSSLDISFYTATLMHGDGTNSLIKNTRFINSSVKANDENWTKIIAIMTTYDTLPTATNQVIYLGGLDISANSTYYIKNLQLEKGNKATDWSPAVEDMENAYTIILTNEAQVIPTDSSRKPTASTTYYTDIQVYKGTAERTDYTIGEINSANGITVSKTASRVNFTTSTGTALSADGGNFTIPITIDDKTFNKVFSWSCSKQGNKGDKGEAGSAGNDAYTVILTNENHTFNADQNGNIASAISTTTNVIVYKGASPITPTIGTLPSVSGLTLSKSETTVTIKANTGTNLADSGSFNIPLTIDGKSFTKTFSWSKSKQGNKGDTGNKGSDAKLVNIISSSQIFKSTDGGLTFTPNTITLTTTLQNVSFSKWQYSVNGGSSWTDVSNGSNGLTISNNNLTISKNSNLYTSTNTSITFKVLTNDSTIYDTMTIVKLYDVTELEIGGRNYIKNGKGDVKKGFFKNFNDVVNGYGEITLTSKKTYSGISIADGFILGCRDYIVDKKIVFSYDIMYTKWDFPEGANRQEFWIGQRYTNSSTSSDGAWRGVTSHNLPVVGENGCKLNEWYHVSKVLTIPSQAEATIGTSSSIQFYNSNADVSASFTARFKNVKLEYGNIETDWTPSPEDVEDNIITTINPLIETDKQLTNRLDNAFSDGVITSYEKIQIASDLKEIDAQYDDITRIVNLYNEEIITGSYNEYKTSYDNLHTILDTILSSMDKDTEYSVSVVKEAFYLYGVNYSHLRASIDNYIKDNFDTTKTTITTLSDNVDIAITKSSSNEQNLNTISKHMKFSDDGWLELFATNNNEEGRFKTRITDTKLSFTDNNNEVAYMSNQQLFINHAQIVNELKIGNIVITKSDNGGIIFRWDE